MLQLKYGWLVDHDFLKNYWICKHMFFKRISRQLVKSSIVIIISINLMLCIGYRLIGIPVFCISKLKDDDRIS